MASRHPKLHNGVVPFSKVDFATQNTVKIWKGFHSKDNYKYTPNYNEFISLFAGIFF